MIYLAICAKGEIGKSSATKNPSAALANMGDKFMQIGCDPRTIPRAACWAGG